MGVSVTYRICEFCGKYQPLASFLPCVKCGKQACLHDLKRHPVYGPYCIRCFQQLLPLQQKLLQDAEDKLRKLKIMGLAVFGISLVLLIPICGIPTWMGGYSDIVFALQFLFLFLMCALWGGTYKIGKKSNPQEFKSPPPLPLN